MANIINVGGNNKRLRWFKQFGRGKKKDIGDDMTKGYG